jgi:hypothetical protein
MNKRRHEHIRNFQFVSSGASLSSYTLLVLIAASSAIATLQVLAECHRTFRCTTSGSKEHRQQQRHRRIPQLDCLQMLPTAIDTINKHLTWLIKLFIRDTNKCPFDIHKYSIAPTCSRVLWRRKFHICAHRRFFFTMAQQPPVDHGLLIIEDPWSHSDTPHSKGLLWASDRPDAETSTGVDYCTIFKLHDNILCRSARFRPQEFWPLVNSEQPHQSPQWKQLLIPSFSTVWWALADHTIL